MDSNTGLVKFRTETGVQGSNSLVSIYSDRVLDESVLKRLAEAIKKAFPKLSNEHCSFISRQMKKEGFTQQQAADAIDNALRTHKYPEPTPAVFLEYNKCYEAFTHHEVEEKHKGNWHFINSAYDRIKLDDKLRYVLKSDVEQYNLQGLLHNPKPVGYREPEPEPTIEQLEETRTFLYKTAKDNRDKLTEEDRTRISRNLAIMNFTVIVQIFAQRGIEI